MRVSKRFLHVSRNIKFHIDLSSSSDQKIYNFGRCDNIRHISTLDLAHNRLSFEIFQQIFHHSKSKLTCLLSLDLSSNFASANIDLSIPLLSKCESLQNLTFLNVSFGMNAHGVKEWFKNSSINTLKILKAAGCGIGDSTCDESALSALAESEVIKNLEWLDLSGNQINDHGMQILFQRLNGNVSKWTRLNLAWNVFGFTGMNYLTSSTVIPNLNALTISHNLNIRDDAILLLCTSESMKHLTHLDLEANSIGNESMRVLTSTRSCITNLTHLNISKSKVTDEGLKLVAHSPKMSKLTSLVSVNNSIGDETALSIASSSFMSQLKHLNLSRCRLTALGVHALIGSEIPRHHLRTLNVWQNPLSEKEKASLILKSKENGFEWDLVI